MQDHGFNPTMVRLLRNWARQLGEGILFQSHNGAIAAFVFLDELFDPDASFNPTMVRLLLWNAGTAIVDNLVSIPQWCDCCKTKPNMLPAIAKFQSHNGAIAAHLVPSSLIPPSCFNPTMVRLLLVACGNPQANPRGFNPTMVRLLHNCR